MFRITPQRMSSTAQALAMLLLQPAAVVAAETAGKTKTTGVAVDYMSSGYLVELIVGLVFVLICIVALAWFARRFRNLQSSAAGSMQVLGGLSMGARERVVLLQVGSARLLLGVAPGRINTLYVLDQDLDEGAAVPPKAEDFAGKLDSALLQRGRTA